MWECGNQRALCRTWFSLLPPWFWELNLGHKALWQVFFPTFWPCLFSSHYFVDGSSEVCGLWALEWAHCSLTSKNDPMPAYTHKEIPNTLALSFSTNCHINLLNFVWWKILEILLSIQATWAPLLKTNFKGLNKASQNLDLENEVRASVLTGQAWLEFKA